MDRTRPPRPYRPTPWRRPPPSTRAPSAGARRHADRRPTGAPRPRARPRRRADVARATAPPAADDHLDRRPARHHRASSSASTASSSQRVPELILAANPALVLAAFLVFYAGFPLRGLRWAILLRGTGMRVAGQGLDRDHLPVVAGQLRRAGQARRRLPRLPAQDQQHGLAVADVRDGLHRAHPRPVRDRPARARGRLLVASATGCRRRSRSSSAIALVVVGRPGHRPVHDAQLRAADHRRAALPAAPGPRAVRPLRGGRLRGAGAAPAADPRRPDRARSG